MERLLHKWRHYRYRFVPWIALNLKDRSVRLVPKGTADQLRSNADVLETLTGLFSAFRGCHGQDSEGEVWRKGRSPAEASSVNLSLMKEVMGFTVERCLSSIQGAGSGVKVAAGRVPQGAVTSLYPGLIYEQHEPILFQSIANPFIFRCIDRVLIDGNDKGVSRFLYRSCAGRDQMGPYAACDSSWLTQHPENPLAVGQYVNNHNKEFEANVAYQEFDVPEDFPFYLRRYLPNNFYSPSYLTALQKHRLIRLVLLVATRDIDCGEELFSSYFTVVH